jgi:hypothetical protein
MAKQTEEHKIFVRKLQAQFTQHSGGISMQKHAFQQRLEKAEIQLATQAGEAMWHAYQQRLGEAEIHTATQAVGLQEMFHDQLGEAEIRIASDGGGWAATNVSIPTRGSRGAGEEGGNE